MAELVGTSRRSRLGDLTDDDANGPVLLAPGGDGLHRPLSGGGGDAPRVEVAVVHTVDGVDHQDEGLVRVTRPLAVHQALRLLEEVGHLGLGPELPALGPDTLRSAGDLVGALLSRVEDDGGPALGEARAHLEHRGGLAGARGAGEEGDLGGDEALAAQNIVTPVDARGDPDVHLGRNLDAIDGGAEVDVVLEVELHFDLQVGGGGLYCPPHISLLFRRAGKGRNPVKFFAGGPG